MNSQPPSNPQKPQGSTNGLCIASFVIALACVFIGFAPGFGFLAILSLILGIIGIKNAKKAGQKKGLGITGVILSLVAMIVTIVTLIAAAAFAEALKDPKVQQELRAGIEKVQQELEAKKEISVEQSGTSVEVEANVDDSTEAGE